MEINIKRLEPQTGVGLVIIPSDTNDLGQAGQSQVLPEGHIQNPSTSQAPEQQTRKQTAQEGEWLREDERIAGACSICQNIGEDLILPCFCEGKKCHKECLKASLLALGHKPLTAEDIKCKDCGGTYKLIMVEELKLRRLLTHPKVCRAVLCRLVEVILTLMFIGGLAYWLYYETSSSSISSLLFVIIQLMFIGFVFLSYFLLEIQREVHEIWWEVGDIRRFGQAVISVESLNELEPLEEERRGKPQLIQPEV